MRAITPQILQQMWPKAPAKTVAEFCVLAPPIFARGITTDRRLKHFMGQISHESAGASLPGMRESLCYTTPERLMKIWPKRFPTIESAAPYLRNEKKLAAKVYNGRMGNRVGTDDGYDFRGGGLLQNTGREMYEKLSKLVGVDLVGNPDLINDLRTNILCAVIEFCRPATLAAADNDNGDRVSRLINGGDNGLEDRRAWTARWGKALAA